MLQIFVEAVLFDFFFYLQMRRLIEDKSAIELPQRILPKRLPMREEIVAIRLPLRPVTSIVNTDEAKRTCHSDNDAEVDESSFEQLRTFVRAVYQFPVHSD